MILEVLLTRGRRKKRESNLKTAQLNVTSWSKTQLQDLRENHISLQHSHALHLPDTEGLGRLYRAEEVWSGPRGDPGQSNSNLTTTSTTPSSSSSSTSSAAHNTYYSDPTMNHPGKNENGSGDNNGSVNGRKQQWKGRSYHRSINWMERI